MSRPAIDVVGAYRDHVSAAMTRFVEQAPRRLGARRPPCRARASSRAAASGTDPDGHQARVFGQPAVPGLPGAAASGQGPPPRRRPGSSSRAGSSRSGIAARPLRSTTRPRATRCGSNRSASRARPVSCAEYLGFIEAGGYKRPEFWLSDGWAAVCQQGWEAPLYWRCDSGEWTIFTLSGRCRLNPIEPVCHISFLKPTPSPNGPAKRLPSEAEWEIAAAGLPVTGNFADTRQLHPRADPMPASPVDEPALRQMFGDVWEWTASPYIPYPRFRAAAGAVGEYNGKFMCNQMVLRGGAAVTPAGHVRPTYRNFFPPSARWAFAGLRLAEDLE